jgi:peptidyl-prolyl cis-trans isomerase C
MFRGLVTGSILLLLAITCFQGNALAQEDAIAALIGNKKITVSDFNTIIGYLDSEKQKAIEKNPQLKESLLRQIVQTMVISDIAKKQGFDNKPDVKKQLELFADNFLVNEFLRREVAQKATVSEDDIKTYYDGHKDEFKTSDMIRARHILIKVAPQSSEEEKKKAKEKAEGILKKIKDEEDFAGLANNYSDDASSKLTGGDLGFFPRGKMVKPFEDAAFALKPGEVSGIVETQFGYHIIKLEEKKAASIEPLENVKERIRQKLLQDSMRVKVSDFIEKAMKDSKVEIHPEVFAVDKK